MPPKSAASTVKPAMVRCRVWSRPLFVAVLVAAASGLAAPAGAETASLRSARDTTLYEDPTGRSSNGSGDYLLAGSNSNGAVRRGLLYFDVAAAIPQGSTITSAAVTLSVIFAEDDTPRWVELHRSLSAWGEGESSDNPGGPGNGGVATEGDATWVNTFYP